MCLLLGGCSSLEDVIDHGRIPCNPATCAGCCTLDGTCMPGGNTFACGAGGSQCRACGADELCSGGACVSPVPEPDGGAVDDGGTACGPSNCGGCCAGNTCVALDAQGTKQCGAAGAACGVCVGLQQCIAGACAVPSQCKLAVSADTGFTTFLPFGEVGVGEKSILRVKLENKGNATCKVDAFRWLSVADQNAFGFHSLPPQPSYIPPGQSELVGVWFSPYALRDWSSENDAFTFHVSDGRPSECASGVPGCRRIRVLGHGVPNLRTPEVPLTPTAISFGEIALGCYSRWRHVLVLNDSGQPLEIVDVFVSGDGFELELPKAPPFLVEPWQTAEFRVRFTPQMMGNSLGMLTIVDGIHGARTVALEGQPTTGGPRVDTFIQRAPADADVLFVVHDGATMAPVQDELAAAVQSFVATARQTQGHFHMGVVTSDVSMKSAGRLQGWPKYITSADISGATALARNLKVGAMGGEDRSMEAMRLALLPPVATDPVRNDRFLRPGTRLAVVFVSNAADSSPAPAEAYARALRVSRGLPAVTDRVRVYPIVPAPQCNGATGRKGLVDEVGGICLPLALNAFESTLGQIAQDLFTWRTEFPLEEKLDASSAPSVWVDNQLLSPSAHYSFDTMRNAIEFWPTSTPEVNQVIRVSYVPQCHP